MVIKQRTSAGSVNEVRVEALVRQRANLLQVILTHVIHKRLQIRLQPHTRTHARHHSTRFNRLLPLNRLKSCSKAQHRAIKSAISERERERERTLLATIKSHTMHSIRQAAQKGLNAHQAGRL